MRKSTLGFVLAGVLQLLVPHSGAAQMSTQAKGVCGGQCVECNVFYERIAVDPNGSYWDYDYECASASCPNPCVRAGIDFPDVDHVLASVEQEDMTAVLATVRNQPEVFLVNEDRRMLQVLNCNGLVAAQIEVSRDMLAALKGEASGALLLAGRLPAVNVY